MSKLRGRKRRHDSTTAWSFALPSDLCAKIDLLLMDPMTGKVRYGSRTQLIETLLRRYLAEQIKAGGREDLVPKDPDRYAGNRGEETEE